MIVEVTLFRDERGFLIEWWKASDFARMGLGDTFVQVNLSYSRAGVLRGLHYQRPPGGQAKLVGVVKGSIYDVVVDLRRDSPTFCRWIGLELSEENRRMLYIPAGCAHGFCVLSEAAFVLYAVTAEYAPDLEAGIRWDDPDLAIAWPVHHPILSPRDAHLPYLREVLA